MKRTLPGVVLLGASLAIGGSAQPSNPKQVRPLILIACGGCSAFPSGEAIFTIHPDGTRFRLVLPSACRGVRCASYSSPRWSRNGARLVFKTRGGIWTSRANGHALRRVTSDASTAPNARDESPVFSPDGRKIVFVREFEGPYLYGSQIWIVDANGRHPHVLVHKKDAHGRNVVGPDWSPRGERIAFCAAPGDLDSWLYVVGADGKGLRRLPVKGEYPRWSPDGNRLAFASGNPGAGTPWVAKILTLRTGHIQTVHVDLGNPTIAWSPDGKKLLASVMDPTAPDGKNYNVTLIRIRDGHQRRLLWRVDSAGMGATDWRG